MRTRSVLLVSLLAALSGCQPEAPPQKTVAPVAVEPAPPEQAVQPAASQAAISAEKAAQTAIKEKTASAEKEKVSQPVVPEKPAPAPAVAAPAEKTEPAAAEAGPDAREAPAVSEAEAMQLAKKSNCLACHAIDRKLVGPAWKDVAARYRGDAGAEARLVSKIAGGGSGVWGVVPMPPSPQLGEADRRTLARFVLSLK